MLFKRLLPYPRCFLRPATRGDLAPGATPTRMASTAGDEGPVTRKLRDKLNEFFKPVHLEVECESHLHNVPRGTEIHFRVQIVSDKFDGLSQLQRQRMVNKVLAEELETCVHALRIEAKRPTEYGGEKQVAAPACGGGKGI